MLSGGGVRESGEQYLQRREYRWSGLGVELARWQGGPATEGHCRLPEHLLFVTLGGATARTEARIEGGQRYAGATSPAPSASSRPTACGGPGTAPA